MEVVEPVEQFTFNVFRVLVIPAQQPTLQFTEIKKEDALKEQFDILSGRQSTHFGSKHVLYSYERNAENEKEIYRYQIGKSGKKTLHKEVDGRPRSYRADDLKLVDVIFLWRRQILLVKKSHSYKNLEVAALFRYYLQNHLRKFDLVISVDAMPSITDFWRLMNNPMQIYELDLEVNQLNIDEGNKNFREVLTKLKETSNDDSLTIKLKNRLGYLSLNNPHIKGVIEYISEVSGRFKTKYKMLDSTKRETYNSDDNIKTTKVTRDIENITDKDIPDNLLRTNEADV